MPLTRLAPSHVHFLRHLYNFSSTTLLHNQPQIPSQLKALIRILNLSSREAPRFCTTSTPQQIKTNLPDDIKRPPQKISDKKTFGNKAASNELVAVAPLVAATRAESTYVPPSIGFPWASPISLAHPLQLRRY